MKAFASDNYSGVHPDVLSAISLANASHAPAYGTDDLTAQARQLLRTLCGSLDAAIEFVFNGTGANCVALQVLTERWDSVLCAESAHINVDEGGAPERLLGIKLLTVPTDNGKLTPELVRKHVIRRGDVHYAGPKVVSITNSTEWGTVYTASEVRALADTAHELGMYLHMDGARISNVAASLGVSIASLTAEAGVDCLSFGGTKNGLLGGEAVVLLNANEKMREALPHAVKQTGQLASKMRFVSAGFLALFGTELYLSNAGHANRMAKLLSERISTIPGITLVQPVEVNAVFCKLPRRVISPLQDEFHFYTWIEEEDVVRMMCSFDTTEEEVDGFVEGIRKAVEG
jgi:threonine aldolase